MDRRCGPRQMRTHCRQCQPVAGNRAQFRARKLFHRIDQLRQPQILAARLPSLPGGVSLPCGLSLSCSPGLKLLAHELCPCQINHFLTPLTPTRSRTTMPQRKSPGCDLVHKGPGRLALKLRNGPENLTIAARSESRRPHRLRLDPHRRRCGPVGADLSHSDLIDAKRASRYTRPVRDKCVRPEIRFSQIRVFTWSRH